MKGEFLLIVRYFLFSVYVMYVLPFGVRMNNNNNNNNNNSDSCTNFAGSADLALRTLLLVSSLFFSGLGGRI